MRSIATQARVALMLVLMALIASPALPVHAAGWGETKALTVAQDAFTARDWAVAAADFGAFATNYPGSEHRAEAVLFEAQARFNLHQYNEAIRRLTTEQPRAGALADKYVYWTAEATFYNADYTSAAETYASLARDYPASTLRLEAAFKEGECYARLGAWPKVIETLGSPEGAFRQSAKSDPTNRFAVQGALVLSGAQAEQKDYAAAEWTLEELGHLNLTPGDEWQRRYNLCRVQLGAGHYEAALAGSTNLLASATAMARPALQAQSVALRGEALEQLGRLSEAADAYAAGLDKSHPAGLRRRAMLKVVELNLRQDQLDAAMKGLADFLDQYPGEKESDAALLAHGELALKKYYLASSPAPELTNALEQASADFARLATAFTNSEFVGKAQLNLGWCRLAQSNLAESEAAFSNAVARLDFSEDAAVARFKLADLQYQRKDFDDALRNYREVVERYGSLPAVKSELAERALYQTVRTALAETNVAAAQAAMQQILTQFPNGQFGGPSELLVGEGLARQQHTQEARSALTDFATRFPDSPLVPEVELAIARTFESETNWDEAIRRYDTWLGAHTNNPAAPQAEFARAWANSQAGRETNAFGQFTNFVALHSTSELAPQAQYWVADHYFRQEDYIHAELNYQVISNNWPSSPLASEAWMMAGRAAAAAADYADAIRFFTNLTSNPSVPEGLRSRAIFAAADSMIRRPPDTNNPEGNFNDAIRFLSEILTRTNEPISVLAQGRIGDCYRQLAALNTEPAQSQDYSLAITNYQGVMQSPLADISARSGAECGLALCIEAMSRSKPAADQARGLAEAMKHYKAVIYGENLREGEKQDLFWVEQAGLAVCQLMEEAGQWEQLAGLCSGKLMPLLPALQSTWEKKIEKAQAQKTAVEKTD